LRPIELGSFDVIIGMDWLAKYYAIIVCAEKIVCIPFGDEILIVRGDGSSNKHGTRLNIITCTKAQEYLTKGCHVFLANITTTKVEDKSKEKRLEDVLVVQEFPEVFFLKDLPGTNSTESRDELQVFTMTLPRLGIYQRLGDSKTPTEIRQFLGLPAIYRRFHRSRSFAMHPSWAIPDGKRSYNAYLRCSKKVGRCVDANEKRRLWYKFGYESTVISSQTDKQSERTSKLSRKCYVPCIRLLKVERSIQVDDKLHFLEKACRNHGSSEIQTIKAKRAPIGQDSMELKRALRLHRNVKINSGRNIPTNSSQNCTSSSAV
ncbi:hypothetical protein Tco_0601465, partial [Tanacetum coccineum]